MTRGRSIRIYLATGEVTGIRHAELDNWTGQAVSCPRSRLGQLANWQEARRPGVYFLVGAEQPGDREVYIGEAEDVQDRVKRHDATRDFWHEVVLFTSKDAHLTKAHVKYLEHRLLGLAKEVGRSRLVNAQGSRSPQLPRADQDAMEHFIDNLRVLVGALGHRFLVPLPSPPGEEAGAATLTYKIRGALAHGAVSDEGFVVFAGSTALRDAKDAMGTGNKALKEELKGSGKLELEGKVLRFTDDVLFNTPSQAAVIVYGNAANGRKAWKDRGGRTLKELEEEALAEE